MLKASWTGLACFSTKQLTLLAVASVKASVHNNPSRIHWVCHNITFQDWSSKYEKNEKLHVHNLTRTLQVRCEFLGTITQIFTVATSRDLVISNTNPTNPNRLSQRWFTWRLLGRLGDLGSTTFGGFLDLIRPFQQLLKQCWNCAFLWPFFCFEAVKFQHQEIATENDIVFPRAPRSLWHLSLFVFHISMWKRQLSIGGLSLPWIERLGRCVFFLSRHHIEGS